MLLSRRDEDAYFAASNSKDGFYSYYGQCFDSARVKRLYAIKGGPGTGKSRFLREVATKGEENGWRAEYIYCSSDPSSLDGVILEKNDACIALLDATAPHVYEPTHPGTREEIINLGAFWESSKLIGQKEEIDRLNAQKGSAYRRAYRYLSGVGHMCAVRDALVAPYVRREAIEAYAARLLREVAVGTGYTCRPALLRAVGMDGAVTLQNRFFSAKTVILVQDCRGISQYLMQALGEGMVQKRQAVRISHDPVCPDRIDGICLEDGSFCVAVAAAGECPRATRTVPMRRFLETWRMHGVRGEVNYAARMQHAMLDGAVEALGEVKAVHFALEEIYSAAMDFAEKEQFTKIFCSRLFDLQNE